MRMRESSDFSRDVLQVQLNQFYAATLAQAKSQFHGSMNVLSAPFMISVSEEYLAAPVRIMFVGKETNGWCGKLENYYDGSLSIKAINVRYENQMSEKHWKGRFFQTLGRIAKELADNKPVAIVWNNLMKMDWDQSVRGSRTSINHSNDLYDLSLKIFRFEIELLKPNVIIFGSGKSYDRAIKKSFPEYITKEINKPKALWMFEINDVICYRTRHPNARQSKSFDPTVDCYTEIIERVRKQFPDIYSSTKHIKNDSISHIENARAGTNT